MKKSDAILDGRFEDLILRFKLNRDQVVGYIRRHGLPKAVRYLEAFSHIVLNREEYPTASHLEDTLLAAAAFVRETRDSLVKTGSARETFNGPQFMRNIVEKCFCLDADRPRVAFGIIISEPSDLRTKRRHYLDYLIENLEGLPQAFWDELSDVDGEFDMALRLNDVPVDFNEVFAPLARYESDCLATYPAISIGGFADLLMMIARTGPEITGGKYAKFNDAIDGITIPTDHSKHSLFFQLLSSSSDIDGLDELALKIIEQDIPNNWMSVVTEFNKILTPVVVMDSDETPATKRHQKKSMGFYEKRGQQLYYRSRKICKLTPSQQLMFDILFKRGSMPVSDLFIAVKRVQSLKNDGRVKALSEVHASSVSAEKIRSNWFAGKDSACLWGTLFKVFHGNDGKEHLDLDFTTRPKP